jgi:3-hydroxybutyryl-CoA dehydrogenase
MSVDPQRICIVGAGRMDEGIALAFMFAGLPVTLIDIQQCEPVEQDRYFRQIEDHLRGELATLARLGSLDPAQVEQAMSHLRLRDREGSGDDLHSAAIVFEAVPEVLELKVLTFAWLSAACGDETVIASATSTFLATQLAALVTHPQRFVKAHWLNPAFLILLVEVSRSEDTCPQVVQRLMALLKCIGKVPVQCSPAAGYIVPRTSTPRFASVSVCVSLCWGCLSLSTGAAATFCFMPPIIWLKPSIRVSCHPKSLPRTWRKGRNGLREGQGFYDSQDVDLEAYKLQRLGEFIRKLELMGLSPVFNGGVATS